MGKTKTAILERKEIFLTDSQNKMIASGWGDDILVNTITEKIFILLMELKLEDIFLIRRIIHRNFRV